jgi:hypothetical protein
MFSLERLNRNAYDNDFTLIINSSICSIPSFIAELFSPTISQIRKTDPTICSFVTDTHYRVNENELKKFFSYLETGSQPPSPSDSLTVIQTSLGIVPDSASFPNDLTTDNVVDTLNQKRICNFDYTQEIEFIARHFSSVYRANLLPPDELLLVLENPFLSIGSEDWLLQFILDFTENDLSGTSFLECIQVEYLSQTSLARYATLVDDMDSVSVGRLWSRMKKLFVRSENLGENPRVGEKGGEVKMYEFKHLTNGKICNLSLLTSTKLDDIASRLRREFEIPAIEPMSFICHGKAYPGTDELGKLPQQKVVVQVGKVNTSQGPANYRELPRTVVPPPRTGMGREEERLRGPPRAVEPVMRNPPPRVAEPMNHNTPRRFQEALWPP